MPTQDVKSTWRVRTRCHQLLQLLARREIMHAVLSALHARDVILYYTIPLMSMQIYVDLRRNGGPDAAFWNRRRIKFPTTDRRGQCNGREGHGSIRGAEIFLGDYS